MKTKLLIIALAMPLVFGCRKFDDSHLWNSINNLNSRIERLEDLCDRMNANISSLQVIVQALQTNDAIKSVTSLPNGEGYTIIFVSGKLINIYNGTNGVDGKDGVDGKPGEDGENGVTPIISVKKDSDGVYYWTVNGDWLIVDGHKVKAVGTDGKDGSNGQDGVDGKPGIDGTNGMDGVTPQFKIEDGYWYISYDNQSWEQLGKASGDNGLNGIDGESVFKGVCIENGYVCFILNDSESTIIKLPFVKEEALTINVEKCGTLKHLLTDEQKRSVLSLKIIGHINEDDIKVLNTQMIALMTLDVSEAFIYPSYSNKQPTYQFEINPYGTSLINRTLRTVVTPKSCTTVWFDYCANLQKIIVPSDSTTVGFNGSNFADASPKMCDNLDTLVFSEGVTYIPEKSAYFFPLVQLPQSTKTVCNNAFTSGHKNRVFKVLCNALTPPRLHNGDCFYDPYDQIKNITLYVPQESLELYKSTSGWNQFKEIIPIEK